MERRTHKDVSCIVGYHTQEWRGDELQSPKKCYRSDAWLGVAYYFWIDLFFTHIWGKQEKTDKTGCYDIYNALIEEGNLLNTVFSEKAYFIFLAKIKETIQHLKSLNVKEIDLEKVNRYLTEKIWVHPLMGIKGIIFEDIPKNNEKEGKIYSEIPPLYYKKRIQIAVYDIKIIHNFELVDGELS